MIKYVLSTTLIFFSFNCIAQQTVRADQLKNINEADQFERIILKECRSLDTLIFPSPIWISDEVSSRYDENFGVILNKKMLLKKMADRGLEEKEFIVRLIIAHEKMHGKQLAILRSMNRPLSALSPEEMKLLECQADMGAGYVAYIPLLQRISPLIIYTYVTLLRSNGNKPSFAGLEEPSEADLKFLLDLGKKNIEGARLFFEIGENDGQFGNHPNSVARSEAYQTGMNAFFACLITIPPDMINKITPAEWQELNQGAIYQKQALGMLDADFYQPGGYFFPWSYRASSDIIHYYALAGKNIIFNVKKSSWDTGIDHPFFHFTIEAENRNPDSMYINATVPMRLVSRTDPDNPLKTKMTGARHFQFKLAPGDRFTFSDSVMWSPGGDTTMPSVRLPGELGSLYSVFPVSFLQMNKYIPVGSSIVLSAFSDSADNVFSADKLIAKLNSIQRTFGFGNDEEFKHSAGVKKPGIDEAVYCTFIAGSSFEMHIPDNKNNKSFLTKRVLSFLDEKSAKDKIKKISDQFQLLNPDYKLTISKGVLDNLPYYEFSDADGKSLFTFYIDNIYLSYNLIVEISK